MRKKSFYQGTVLFQFLVLIMFVGPTFGALQFPTAVNLESSVYFQQPDGQPIQLRAGVYEVEPGGEAALQVHAIGAKAEDVITIQAIAAEHDQELTEATADLIPSPNQDADKQHLLLSMPNGEALEAVGSLSGVFSRSALTWATATNDGEEGSSEDSLILDFEETIYFKTVGGGSSSHSAWSLYGHEE